MLHKVYESKCSIENKNSGRESQGPWWQDEVIGGKPPVVKWLWLSTTQLAELDWGFEVSHRKFLVEL
jgi:hypothetical protein